MRRWVRIDGVLSHPHLTNADTCGSGGLGQVGTRKQKRNVGKYLWLVFGYGNFDITLYFSLGRFELMSNFAALGV